MSLWTERTNELEHYYTLRREAEQHRLARMALVGHRKTRDAFYRMMIWLGARLAAWGKQLNERYESAIVNTPVKGIYL